MHRYTRVEYERRFLVAELPQEKPWAVRRMVDRYIDGTRIRLRQSEGVVDGRPETVLKLTQKIPSTGEGPPGRQGELTSFYLTDEEYNAIKALPAAVIAKTRYSFPPLGVDVFEGPLEGLLIAEMEFETEADMLAAQPPSYCVKEITTDKDYAGGKLARLSAEQAAALARLSAEQAAALVRLSAKQAAALVRLSAEQAAALVRLSAEQAAALVRLSPERAAARVRKPSAG